MNSNEILDEIKEINGIKTDTDLAKLLDCNKSRISVWRKNRFHKSTSALLENLINNYKQQAE